MRSGILHIISGIGALMLLGCSSGGETTEMGAAAGGALGAGLGAIVGSTTGDAGGGLVVGAVAGAGTGAAVGNALEAQQEAIQSQDEAIERQQQQIRAQRVEIEELRRLSQDSIQYRGSFVAASGAAYGAQRDSFIAQRVAEMEDRPSQGEVVARVPDSTEFDAASTPKSESPMGKYRWSNPESDRAPQAAALPPQKETNLQDFASEECHRANQEMKLLEQAPEMADKLFHNRRALRLCPDNADYHHRLAELYLDLGRREDARFELREALRLNPDLQAAQASLNSLSAERRY